MGLVVVTWCCPCSPCSYFSRRYCHLWYRWVYYNGMDNPEWKSNMQDVQEVACPKKKKKSVDCKFAAVKYRSERKPRLRLRFLAGWDWPRITALGVRHHTSVYVRTLAYALVLRMSMRHGVRQYTWAHVRTPEYALVLRMSTKSRAISVWGLKSVVVWLFIGTRKRLVTLYSVPKAHAETDELSTQCNLSTWQSTMQRKIRNNATKPKSSP
jgi:hypothetical protein